MFCLFLNVCVGMVLGGEFRVGCVYYEVYVLFGVL